MEKSDRLGKLKLQKWQLRKNILEMIVLSLVTGGTKRSPILPLMVKEIIDWLKKERDIAAEEKKIMRVLESLEKRNIISLEEKGDKIYVRAVDEGNPIVIKYSIKALIDFKKKKKIWNGKWYLVFFDVPEIQRNKRNILRRFLTRLGFYRYQKSVYLLPYECEEEIKLIKKVVEGAKYMKYIIAEKIEDAEEAKIFFKLLK